MQTSLYVHIPFCRRKCPYCSFCVCVSRLNKVDVYLDCLEREARFYQGTAVSSVYAGGGTPSLLSPKQFLRMHEIIRGCFNAAAGHEYNVELNPEDADKGRLRILTECGFNRISLGVQSLSDRWLKYLGRGHDAKGARRAFDQLRRHGFKNINLDLMYGFPGQTEKEIRKDVEAIGNMGSEHVSLYSLTIDPQSRFHVRKTKLPDMRKQVIQYEQACDLLRQRGFCQYEVSNFCRPGKESRHNLHYWQQGDYIGLGLGAHSHREGLRSWNVAGLRQYLQKVENDGTAREGSEQLTFQQRFWEAVVFGLRMNKGVSLKQLEQVLHYAPDRDRLDRIKSFIDQGWLMRQRGYLRATDQGRNVLDELAVYLV